MTHKEENKKVLKSSPEFWEVKWFFKWRNKNWKKKPEKITDMLSMKNSMECTARVKASKKNKEWAWNLKFSGES